MDVKIEPSWKQKLAAEFEQPYFQALTTFVRQEYQATTVYPPPGEMFNAFAHTPFEAVRVVLLGQDPYHGPGQAHGLCFSVRDGVRPPPSLQNMFKEIQSDVGSPVPTSGNLERWADQGVFLLNATLTVRAGQAGSHQGKGWETFTDAVIKLLSDEKEHLVFLLWGNYARQKSALIDSKKHLILQAPHPSPFSAHNGFFGCKHFSKTNAYLAQQGFIPIEW
jgi:uracil-DNA glycosylase